ncbi:hypothetical protein OIU78_002156 [Salix suchowensis]|nr:hypothetical protein OIU78_002156 [Salix suchowensis]
MEDYNRSRSYSYSHGNDRMQMESYHGPQRPPTSHELRSYSTSYAQTQMANGNYSNSNFANNRDFKAKKGKDYTGSSSSKSWSFDDPEFQRKKRVASYKMYSVEGKVKGTFRKSFRWIKDSADIIVIVAAAAFKLSLKAMFLEATILFLPRAIQAFDGFSFLNLVVPKPSCP